MNNKHEFIYEENERLGKIFMVEIDDNTTAIHQLKKDKEQVYKLNASWWDLDAIRREIKSNEKEIEKAVKCGKVAGVVEKMETIKEDLQYLPENSKNQLLPKVDELLTQLKEVYERMPNVK